MHFFANLNEYIFPRRFSETSVVTDMKLPDLEKYVCIDPSMLSL